MRAYGLPRDPNLECPDLVDIQKFGLKSSKSRVRNISGNVKNSFRSSDRKSAARRVWKKKERSLNKPNYIDYLI
jgi:hypothetical protein